MMHKKRDYPYQTQKHRQRRKTKITLGMCHFDIQPCQKRTGRMECGQVIFFWSWGGGVTGDTVPNVMCGIVDEKDKSQKVQRRSVHR